MRAVVTAAVLSLVACTAPAQELAYKLFGAEDVASHQQPASIGSYARGCGAGFVQLPETGPTWQAMRLSRNRNWGNPETIAFIERLSREAATLKGWKGLYVGDIGQPRGGPMNSGHLSHQIGLDVDIWFTPPKRLNLTRHEREKMGAISIRTKDMKSLNSNWTPQDAKLLEMAAKDPAVDRIFVTAPAKIEMCKTAKKSDASWLRKIRPLYGHDDHFHVRLKCPEGSKTCVPQKPTVYTLSHGGDGCDKTLEWWVTGYIYALKHPKPPNPNAKPPKNARTYTMNDLPGQCAQVLSSR
jgi:penicillin-insensitive murein endopeptidase